MQKVTVTSAKRVTVTYQDTKEPTSLVRWVFHLPEGLRSLYHWKSTKLSNKEGCPDSVRPGVLFLQESWVDWNFFPALASLPTSQPPLQIRFRQGIRHSESDVERKKSHEKQAFMDVAWRDCPDWRSVSAPQFSCCSKQHPDREINLEH